MNFDQLADNREILGKFFKKVLPDLHMMDDEQDILEWMEDMFIDHLAVNELEIQDFTDDIITSLIKNFIAVMEADKDDDIMNYLELGGKILY